MILKTQLAYLIILLVLTNIASGKYSGGTGEPNDPYLIETPNDLNSIGLDPCDWDKYFLLTADINLGVYTGEQFNMIGYWTFSESQAFTGVFDGNGHTISNFRYDSSSTHSVGIFGYINDANAEVRSLGIVEPNVHTEGIILGSLAGYVEGGAIVGCFVEGGSVGGFKYVGALVGYNGGRITDCHAKSRVTATHVDVGGLVGYNDYGTITNCDSAGNVEGEGWDVGGLVGNLSHGNMINCYSTADCNGEGEVGGLVGLNYYSSIVNSYSTGNVSGTYGVGGLVGWDNDGSYTKCFWDSDINPDVNGIGNTTDPNVIGESTANMKIQSTFTNRNWDFVGEIANGYEDMWRMCVDGVNYPKLSWEFLGYGDLTCPDGVDFIDYSVLANEWLLERLEQDYNSDGRVNFKDWAIFADNWDGSYTELPPFVACWLGRSARIADIAPSGGDDFVDWRDLTILAMHWLDEK